MRIIYQGVVMKKRVMFGLTLSLMFGLTLPLSGCATFKKVGHDIGHAGKEVGHAAKKAGKDVGHAIKDS